MIFPFRIYCPFYISMIKTIRHIMIPVVSTCCKWSKTTTFDNFCSRMCYRFMFNAHLICIFKSGQLE